MSTEPVGRHLFIYIPQMKFFNQRMYAAVGTLGANGWLWFVLIAVLMLIAGYFAASETALNSLNKIRIKNLAENGSKRAERVLKISDNMEKAVSTILIGTNVMHISCASISTFIATKLWGVNAVALSTVVMTLLVFMFAETIPKSLASEHAESYALFVSGSLSFIMLILTPVSYIFIKISEFFTHLLSSEKKPTVDEDELYDIIETIQEEGAVEENKTNLIYSALEFDDISVSDVLTSRIDVIAIDINDSIEEIIETVKSVKFSRLPVKDGSVDNMIGVISIRRLIKNYLTYKDKIDIKSFIDEPVFVHKSMPVDELLKEMNRKKQHMAIVRDEYGGTFGIVTAEDILEELVGEIWDEDDEVRVDMIQLEDNLYELSGEIYAVDVFREIDFEDYERDEIEYKTMSAWALSFFDENIPHEGSKFKYKNLEVTITEMHHFRITKMTMFVGEENKDNTSEEEVSK